MKPLLFVFLLFFNFSPNRTVQADIMDDLALQFKNSNSKDIAKNFAPSIELLIVDQEDVYNKAQAEQILKDFFVKNPPSKITIIHRLNNNQNFRYGILGLQTKNSKFRVTITMMHQKGTNVYLIGELRIEKD